jgi:hypothetical protein
MDYYKEIRKLSKQAEEDGELIIAQTLITLCGVIHSPVEMQNYFSVIIEEYTKLAIAELEMIQNSRLN